MSLCPVCGIRPLALDRRRSRPLATCGETVCVDARRRAMASAYHAGWPQRGAEKVADFRPHELRFRSDVRALR